MKWFFKWIRNGINTVDMDERADRDRSDERKMGLAINMPKVARPRGLKAATDDGSIHLQQHPMHFKIYPATGGHIIEYTYYNERKDTNDQALHLIPSDLDLGTELAKIMTLEAFKR